MPMIYYDHCRIGSLETVLYAIVNSSFDHCRIGSLESYVKEALLVNPDHCRIGSLEIVFVRQF